MAIFLPCVGTIAVGMRFYVRRLKGTSLLGDDWTILAALVLTWILGIILIVGDAAGALGTHTPTDPKTGADIPTPASIFGTKLYYAFVIIFILTIGLVKASVLLFYRRIFVSEIFRRISLGLLILVILWTTAFFLARVFACGSHFTAFWTNGASIAKFCGPYQDIELGFAISDVITDLMVLATPLHFIWTLQMNITQKIVITFIFLLGLLSTASGIVRLAFLIINGFETKPGFRDVIGIDTVVLAWSQVEAGIGVLAACLPTLRPLFMGKAPESLINSLRSALSLHSLGSSGRRRTESNNNNSATNGSGVEDTSKLVYDASNPGMNTEVTRDLEAQPPVPRDGILLQNSFTYRESEEGSLRRVESRA